MSNNSRARSWRKKPSFRRRASTPRPGRSSAILVSAAAAALAFLAAPALTARTTDGVTGADGAVLARFLARPSELHAYEATRHLEAGALGHHGWIDAHTRYTPHEGFTFEVTATGGSGFIDNHVLKPMLQREKEAIETGDSSKSAVDRSNYDLSIGEREDDGIAQILLRPKRREDTLIDGAMLVSADTGLPVRLQGKLAKNPSFWIKRADVVRSYAHIGSANVPIKLESTAEIRIFGKSSLTMTYDYTTIDGKDVRFEAASRGDAVTTKDTKTD